MSSRWDKAAEAKKRERAKLFMYNMLEKFRDSGLSFAEFEKLFALECLVEEEPEASDGTVLHARLHETGNPNVILWETPNKLLVYAYSTLLEEQRLEVYACSPLVYITKQGDDVGLDYPLLSPDDKDPDEAVEEAGGPVWLPVLLKIKKSGN
jgi:hypothetical protein